MEREYYVKLLEEKANDRAFLINKNLNIGKNASMILRYSKSFGSEIGMLKLNLDLNDTIQAKQEYFKLLRGSEFDMWYKYGLYPEIETKRDKKYNFLGRIAFDYPDIFLCDHEEALLYIFNFVKEGIKKYKIRTKEEFVMTAFIMLVLNEKEKAKILIDENYLKAEAFLKGLGFVVAGILNNNISLVNKGILLQMAYKGVEVGSDAGYHHKATGLAKIALRFGMEPDLSDSRINKKLLEHDNIDYVDIDDLFGALGVEPIVRHKLRNY